jgi:hypothetical protein
MILFKNLKVGEFFSYNGMIYEKVNEHQARSTRKIMDYHILHPIEAFEIESVEPTIFLVGSIKQNPYYYKITGPYCFIKAPYPWIAQKKYNDFYQGKYKTYLLGFKDDIGRISSLVSEDIRDLIKQIETGEIQVDFIN